MDERNEEREEIQMLIKKTVEAANAVLRATNVPVHERVKLAGEGLDIIHRLMCELEALDEKETD